MTQNTSLQNPPTNSEPPAQPPAQPPTVQDVSLPKIDIQPTDSPKDEFDPEDLPYTKQMSNAARQHFANRIKKIKELSTKLKELESRTVPESYYDNPRAFVLLPEYEDYARKYAMASSELEHWKAQLAAIENGDEWRNILGYDENGRMVYGEPQEPSVEAKVAILSALQKAQALQQAFEKELVSLQTGFKEKYSSAESLVKKLNEQFFDWAKDSKLEESIKVQVGDKEVPVKELKRAVMDKMPSAYKNHPLATTVANMYAALHIYNMHIRNLQNELQKAKEQKQEIIKSEPSSSLNKSGKLEDINFSDDELPE